MSSLLSSDVLTPRQLAFIAERLPEPPCAPRGRRPHSNLQLLPGILRVLRSGSRWRDLDRVGSPSGVTHWRRLDYWHRRRGYRRVWHSLLNFLVQSKRLDRSLVSLDGSLIPSQEFTERPATPASIGLSGRSCHCWWTEQAPHSPRASRRATITTRRSGSSPSA